MTWHHVMIFYSMRTRVWQVFAVWIGDGGRGRKCINSPVLQATMMNSWRRPGRGGRGRYLKTRAFYSIHLNYLTRQICWGFNDDFHSFINWLKRISEWTAMDDNAWDMCVLVWDSVGCDGSASSCAIYLNKRLVGKNFRICLIKFSMRSRRVERECWLNILFEWMS